MKNLENQEAWKGAKFWDNEITKAEVKNKLRFFNDIVTEKRLSHPDSKYGEAILIDLILDGKKCDIYHTDKTNQDTWHRLFLPLFLFQKPLSLKKLVPLLVPNESSLLL